MKRFLILSILMILLGICCQSCSHNPAAFVFGKQIKMGNLEYGEISYLDGVAIIDISRENSMWSIEIDDETGLSYDAESKTIKGIKKITRSIGKQVTGYLNDLAKNSPTAVENYLSETKEK